MLALCVPVNRHHMFSERLGELGGLLYLVLLVSEARFATMGDIISHTVVMRYEEQAIHTEVKPVH